MICMVFLKKPAYRQKKTFNGEKVPSVYRFCSKYNMYVPSFQ